MVSCFTNDGGARKSPGRWQTWQAGNAREWMFQCDNEPARPRQSSHLGWSLRAIGQEEALFTGKGSASVEALAECMRTTSVTEYHLLQHDKEFPVTLCTRNCTEAECRYFAATYMDT